MTFNNSPGNTMVSSIMSIKNFRKTSILSSCCSTQASQAYIVFPQIRDHLKRQTLNLFSSISNFRDAYNFVRGWNLDALRALAQAECFNTVSCYHSQDIMLLPQDASVSRYTDKGRSSFYEKRRHIGFFDLTSILLQLDVTLS